ncbi:MAG: phage tail protein [Actinomycetota bacterium]
MRKEAPGLPSPHPLGQALPGLYQEDDLAQRLTLALDGVLAPIFATLDCLYAYIDPWLAPPDFLRWLAGWFALTLDGAPPLRRQRALVAEAVRLYRRRGTAEGLASFVALLTGITPEITDSGGARWSLRPNSRPPGSARQRVKVRLQVPRGRQIERGHVEAIVALTKPANLAHEVEIVEISGNPDGRP